MVTLCEFLPILFIFINHVVNKETSYSQLLSQFVYTERKTKLRLQLLLFTGTKNFYIIKLKSLENLNKKCLLTIPQDIGFLVGSAFDVFSKYLKLFSIFNYFSIFGLLLSINLSIKQLRMIKSNNYVYFSRYVGFSKISNVFFVVKLLIMFLPETLEHLIGI